jgi:hypothetical protein
MMPTTETEPEPEADTETDPHTTPLLTAQQQATVERHVDRITNRTPIPPAAAEAYVLRRRGLSISEIATQRGVGEQATEKNLDRVRDIYAECRVLTALKADDPEDDPEYGPLWDAGPELISEHTTLTPAQAAVWDVRERNGRMGWADTAGQALGDLAGDGRQRAYNTVNDHVTKSNEKVEAAKTTVEMIELDGLLDDVVAITDQDASAIEAELSADHE